MIFHWCSPDYTFASRSDKHIKVATSPTSGSFVTVVAMGTVGLGLVSGVITGFFDWFELLSSHACSSFSNDDDIGSNLFLLVIVLLFDCLRLIMLLRGLVLFGMINELSFVFMW